MKKSLIIVLIIIMSVVGLNAINDKVFTVNGQNSTTEFQRNNDLTVNYSLKERFAEIKERIGEREFNKKAYFWGGLAMAAAIPAVASLTYIPFLGGFYGGFGGGADYFGYMLGWSYLFSFAAGIGFASLATIPFAGPIISTAGLLALGIFFCTYPPFIAIGVGLILTGLIEGGSIILQHMYLKYMDRGTKQVGMYSMPVIDDDINPEFVVGLRFAL